MSIRQSERCKSILMLEALLDEHDIQHEMGRSTDGYVIAWPDMETRYVLVSQDFDGIEDRLEGYSIMNDTVSVLTVSDAFAWLQSVDDKGIETFEDELEDSENAVIRAVADELYRHMGIFVNAGFSEDQAFDLVKISFRNSLPVNNMEG